MLRSAGAVLAAVPTVLALTASAGCVDIPGTQPGAPCNSQGVCRTGLVCDEGTCRDTGDPQAASSWELMLTPFDTRLNAVWGRSADDVYAVGDSGVILHHAGDGRDWREVKHGLAISGNLHAVYGDDQRLWVGGSGGMLQRDQGGWTRQVVYDVAEQRELASSFVVYGIAGSPRALPVAVGSTSGSYGAGLVLRLAAGQDRWDKVDAGLSFVGRGVWVQDVHAYIVGDAKHVKLFDGSGWTEQNLAEKLSLQAIWGADDGTLIAVGPAGSYYRRASDVPGWEQFAVRAGYQAHGLWGTADDGFFIVGAGQGYPSDSFSSIEKCDSGHRCVQTLVPAEARGKTLRGIWGDRSALYAVGDGGIVLRRKQ